jgi:hypothetical protein
MQSILPVVFKIREQVYFTGIGLRIYELCAEKSEADIYE